MPLPDKEARKEILKVHTSIVRHVPVELTETGIELNEGIDELSVRERAMSLFLCG